MQALLSLWPFQVVGERHHDPPQQLQDVQQPSADCPAVTSCPHTAEEPPLWLEVEGVLRQPVSSMAPAPVQHDSVQHDSACNMYGEAVILIPADEEDVGSTGHRLGSMSHAAGVSPEVGDAQPAIVIARPPVAAQSTPADTQDPCVSLQQVRNAVTAAACPEMVASTLEALPQQQSGCPAWATATHACELAGICTIVTSAAAAHIAPMQRSQLHVDHDSARVLHVSTSQGSSQSAASQSSEASMETLQLGLPAPTKARIRGVFPRDDSCHLAAASHGMHITFQASPLSSSLLIWQPCSVTHA